MNSPTVFDIPNDQPPPVPLAITDGSAANQIVYSSGTALFSAHVKTYGLCTRCPEG